MNVRAVAAQTLAQVFGEGRSLATALPPALARINTRDRGLLQELCHGVCRWYPQLQRLLEELLERPLAAAEQGVRALLLVGLYQLWHLRVPEHAAVSETVAAARQLQKPWAAGLANAILRNAIRRRQALMQALENDLQAVTAHPRWLLERLQQDWPEDWSAIVAANNARPPFVIRVNPRCGDREDYRQRLAEKGWIAERTLAAAMGLVLQDPVEVTELPGFDKGWVSVQDAAAQLAAPLLRLESGQRVLDACAAPGGKTGHLLEYQPSVELTALDRDAERLQHVQANLDRLQAKARLIPGDAAEPASWWDGVPFERILLDAPCSATGVIRRHPDVKLLRRESDIAALAQQQRRLLLSLWPLLRPGGHLLYVTCSVLRQENDDLIAAFLASQKDAEEVPIDAEWGRPLARGRQLLPGEAGMDGFYYASLYKRAFAAGR